MSHSFCFFWVISLLPLNQGNIGLIEWAGKYSLLFNFLENFVHYFFFKCFGEFTSEAISPEVFWGYGEVFICKFSWYAIWGEEIQSLQNLSENDKKKKKLISMCVCVWCFNKTGKYNLNKFIIWKKKIDVNLIHVSFYQKKV